MRIVKLAPFPRAFIYIVDGRPLFARCLEKLCPSRRRAIAPSLKVHNDVTAELVVAFYYFFNVFFFRKYYRVSAGFPILKKPTFT